MRAQWEDAAKRVTPRPLREGAKYALRAAAVACSPLRQLPDFLIIGTKRGGTTSLFRYLLAHPLVAPMFPAAQQLKSPHFFDIHYARGVAWYRSHFPSAPYRRLVAARRGRPPLAGEASPYYLFHPLAAERIRRVAPRAMLLVLLRDPVDRAWSHYQERVGQGLEPLGFEEAIEREPERLRGERQRILADPRYYSLAHDSYSYLARGCYLEQLEAYLARFPRRQLCILRSEDLFADPAAAHARALRFLGLPEIALPEYRRHNQSPAASMAQATRERLAGFYAPRNRALAERLGMRFDWTC